MSSMLSSQCFVTASKFVFIILFFEYVTDNSQENSTSNSETQDLEFKDSH